MSISYQSATPADASSFAHCQIEAFMEDRFYQATFGLTPTSPPEQIQENIEYRIKRYQQRLKQPHVHWIKAVDDSTGAVVGISGWEEPESRRAKSSGNSGGEELKWLSSWNKEFIEEYDKKLEEATKAALGDTKGHWYVAMMAVLPSYRGRGIGQELVMRGVELADKAGESIYLENTPAAKKIYERAGFETVATMEGPNDYWTNVMLRKSRG